MQKIFGALFLGLLCWLPGKAQQRNIDFIRYRLPNGLKVILHRDTTAPVVAVTVLYHVGSKNEKPGQTGFAHFFEHLMFEGSTYIRRGEFMKYVSNAGGQLNANTSQDRTFYYENMPSNQLKLALWLESERMLHGKIDTVGVNTQREVVKEEKRMRVDNRPYGTLLQEVCKRAFKGTPYQWVPIGSMEDLNKAVLGDFIEFYHTYYVPGNAVLSIAGDIDTARTRELVAAYFGSIPASDKPIRRPQVQVQPLGHEIRDTVYDNIQLPAVIEAYRVPRQGTPDYYAFNVLAQLLAGGPSARLQRVVKDQQQLAAGIEVVPLSLEDAGLFLNLGVVNVGVDPDTLQQAIDAQVALVKQDTVPEHEFLKVMNQIETDFISGNARMLGIAEKLADYEVYFGDANLINTELDRYRRVTREDLRRVARKYLTPDNRVVLYYLPKAMQSGSGSKAS
ncbi:pitrilysin family protein [Compostibacter hankyongensis]|uniref:Pitrilysin family protein n=1 Tax=Compostibacter hankyongensis TaxID=1007089 RepID=A0ABP8FEU0_9BACT